MRHSIVITSIGSNEIEVEEKLPKSYLILLLVSVIKKKSWFEKQWYAMWLRWFGVTSPWRDGPCMSHSLSWALWCRSTSHPSPPSPIPLCIWGLVNNIFLHFVRALLPLVPSPRSALRLCIVIHHVVFRPTLPIWSSIHWAIWWHVFFCSCYCRLAQSVIDCIRVWLI